MKLLLSSELCWTDRANRADRADLDPLLLGSMYFWLIQFNRSYRYNENIARTGISTLNGHISKPVALREKLRKI